jgi:hypothetical protein
MRIAAVFRATISKDLDIEGSNEDTYCLRLNEEKPRAAVFDGASESFAARKWSRYLSNEWGKTPTLDWSWVERAQKRYARNISTLQLSWAQEAAMQRGSYSTIAYVQFEKDWLFFSAVGDSNIFLISNDEIRFSYPYVKESQFTSAPNALSSNPLDLRRNRENLLLGLDRIRYRSMETRHVILATDAVSAWLLNEDNNLRSARLKSILRCSSLFDFKSLIVQERKTHAMKMDDSTLVILEVT